MPNNQIGALQKNHTCDGNEALRLCMISCENLQNWSRNVCVYFVIIIIIICICKVVVLPVGNKWLRNQIHTIVH